MFSKRVPLSLWAPAVLSGLVALAPLWYLVTRATSRGWTEIADELFQGRTFDLVVRSLVLCAAVTAACVVIGTFAAWVIVFSGLPGRTVLTVAFSLPLAIPSYLSAFAWIDRWPGLAGFWGAFVVLTFATFPYVMLPVTAAFSRLDPTHEDVARSLGRSGAGVLFGVVLPQARRSIAAGALLSALYVLSDFGAVATMRHEVFTWVIYGAYRAGFNPSRAAILATTLVLLASLLVAAESRARGRAAARVGGGT
ncbi:MAG: ABC transporter permease, partial [Ilumatobacteraceae bacterium]